MFMCENCFVMDLTTVEISKLLLVASVPFCLTAVYGQLMIVCYRWASSLTRRTFGDVSMML